MQTMWQDSRVKRLNFWRTKMSVVTLGKFLRRGASTKQARTSFYLFIHDAFSVATLDDLNRRRLSSRGHNTNVTRALSSSPDNSKVNNFRLLTDTLPWQSWYLRVCFGRSQVVQLGNLYQMSSFHRYDTYLTIKYIPIRLSKTPFALLGFYSVLRKSTDVTSVLKHNGGIPSQLTYLMTKVSSPKKYWLWSDIIRDTSSLFYAVNSAVCANPRWPGGQTGAAGFGGLPHQAGPGVFAESHTICRPASCCWYVWSWADGLRTGGQV